MTVLRARCVATKKLAALVCVAWLFTAASAVAAPITVGSLNLQNDPNNLNNPTFQVFNTSQFAGYAVLFSDVHLVFDLQDMSTADFALAASLAPGGSVDSDSLVGLFGQSLLPDLSSVLDAYLTLTLLDPATSALLAGTLSLAPTTPFPLCAGCTDRMIDFNDLSALAIQFDPAAPTDVTPVPEPVSMVLVGTGLAACVARRRSHRM